MKLEDQLKKRRDNILKKMVKASKRGDKKLAQDLFDLAVRINLLKNGLIK